MANYKVGDVTKFTLVWRDSRFQGVFKNILHYRGIEATMTSAQMRTWVEGGLPTFFSRLFDQLNTTTYMSEVHVENLTDLTEPTVDVLFTAGDLAGIGTPNDDDTPQACACVTRKSFLRGRKAVGHFYFGPLPAMYTEAGLVVVDPVGLGDLGDVLDNLGDPMTDPATGWTARPIVCNAAGSGVVPNNDVRIQSFAAKTVYLKSRRPGIGE